MTYIRFTLTSAIFALLCFPVIAWAWFDYLHGGDGWRQGDWLINFGDGPVRRGAIGEALIWISDISGISLLVTVIITQVLIFTLTVFVLWVIALRYSTPALLWLFALAPAGFVTFFAANPVGSMRKEFLGVFALALIVLASMQSKRTTILSVLGLVTYAIGCLGNILHCLMLPIFLAAFYRLYQQQRLTTTAFGILAGLAVLIAALTLGFAFQFNDISMLEPVCDPLTTRGMRPEICNDAIRWLVIGEVDHKAELVQRLTLVGLAEYTFVAALSVLPLWLTIRLFKEKSQLWFLTALCFLPLLPLYVSATDWGRWLSLSYTAAILMIIQAHSTGHIHLRHNPNPRVTIALIPIFLLMAPEHSLGWQPGGAAKSVMDHILIFLS